MKEVEMLSIRHYTPGQRKDNRGAGNIARTADKKYGEICGKAGCFAALAMTEYIASLI